MKINKTEHYYWAPCLYLLFSDKLMSLIVFDFHMKEIIPMASRSMHILKIKIFLTLQTCLGNFDITPNLSKKIVSTYI